MIELKVEQKSLEWHEARSGIVTGTTMKQAVGTPATQNTLMNHLIAERMAQQVFADFTTDATAHGNDSEGMALGVASKALDTPFRKCGFLLSTIIKGVGFSPDGVTDGKDDEIVGGIEIKCPSSSKHIEYVLANIIPKEYKHQFLTPFILSDTVKWWVFMSYDYRNYQRPEFYVHVDREAVEPFVKIAREKLIKFVDMVDDEHIDLCLTSGDVGPNVLKEAKCLEVK